MSVTIIVPTYRPTEETVSLVRELSTMGAECLVSDDASPCTSDPTLSEISRFAPLIRHRENAGIARALNDGIRAAQASGHKWLLTFDQDSTPTPDYIEEVVRFAQGLPGNRSVGAIGARIIKTPGGELTYPEKVNGSLLTTHEVFQSGTLWRVEPMLAVGGFDETLGMDAVDAAACLRLRQAGFSIVLVPDLTLDHAWGESELINVPGRSVAITHHSPERRRTMVRNRLRLAPEEFRASPVHGARTLRRLAVGTVLAVTRENQRAAKLRATLAGLRDSRSR